MEKTPTYSREKAISELKALVLDWLSGKSDRSIASMARGAKVSEACVRRILNDNSMPITENLQKILSFLNSGGTHKQILGSLGEDLRKHIKFELSYLKFEEVQDYVSMVDKESFLPDFVHQAIFERSSISKGISFDEIKNMFGAYGETAAMNLVTAKLAHAVDGQLVCVPELKNHSWSISTYKQFLSDAIKNFYKTTSDVNYIFNVNEGVSETGYSKVMDVIEVAHKNISSLVKDNPGEIPLSVGGFMDTMTYQNIFVKNRETD